MSRRSSPNRRSNRRQVRRARHRDDPEQHPKESASPFPSENIVPIILPLAIRKTTLLRIGSRGGKSVSISIPVGQKTPKGFRYGLIQRQPRGCHCVRRGRLKSDCVGRKGKKSGFVPHIRPHDDQKWEKVWSEWQDLNLRPPRPERGARIPFVSTRRMAIETAIHRWGARCRTPLPAWLR
jgi:hypothetical protein